jgi:hypothetical protein
MNLSDCHFHHAQFQDWDIKNAGAIQSLTTTMDKFAPASDEVA